MAVVTNHHQRDTAVAAVEGMPRRSATRELRDRLGLGGVPAELARDIRPVAREVAGEITDAILSEIAAYAASGRTDTRRTVERAVSAAVDLFVDVIEGEPTDPGHVSTLFAGMGHSEALAGHSLDGMRAALNLATHRAAGALRRGAATPIPEDSCALLVSALLAYMETLAGDVAEGHHRGVLKREEDMRFLRRRLFELILSKPHAAEIPELARRASWQAPDAIVVCSVDFACSADALRLPHDALVGIRRRRVYVLTADQRQADTCARMRTWSRTSPVVATCAVPVADVPAAMGWADRALRLVAEGVIPRAPVIQCADHHTALLLHADPALARREATEVLAPLSHCKGAYRRALCRTLRLWLQTGDDAKRLAARLGLHEHTVRNHKQKLVELYGERLSDPDYATVLVFALSAEARGAAVAEGTPSESSCTLGDAVSAP